MDTRTSQLAARVRSAREAQGYRSQASFAAAAEVSPRSISAIELGERVGRKVLRAISRTLGWPSEAAWDFLQTGDATLLAPSEPPGTAKTPASSRTLPTPAELLDMPGAEVIRWSDRIRAEHGDEAADRFLGRVYRLKEAARDAALAADREEQNS